MARITGSTAQNQEVVAQVTWLLNCGLAPAPAAGHPPPAGPPWRGATVLEGGTEWEGVTECVTPF